MSLIETVQEKEANGFIAQVYSGIKSKMNRVPNVIKFHTASPELFEKVMPVFDYYSGHPNLDPILVAYIRMLLSGIYECNYCIRFQTSVLKFMGISENDIDQAKENYYKVNLDYKRKLLLCFVLDEMQDKIENPKERINELTQFGWTEKDIYEASILGALQRGMVQLIKTFKVDIDF